MLEIQLPIASPPWTKLGRKLESMCRKALFDFSLLGDTQKIAIALSGGKDSLTLLFLLKAILGKGFPNLEMHAIHISGEFSCGAGVSVNYLRGICKKLEVNFIERYSTQKRESLECYSCSRERRRLLFDAAKEVGTNVVAFGHHRDDNVQTLLMNLLHKAEFAGMLPKVPMHDYGVTIIRPLIYIPEESIKEFAKSYGFARITCACPVGQTSLRMKTKEMVALLEKQFPNAQENIAAAIRQYGSQKALYS